MHFSLSETKSIILFITFLIYHSERRKTEDKRRLKMSSEKKRRNRQIQADRISLTNDENVVAIRIDIFFPSGDYNHERDSIER